MKYRKSVGILVAFIAVLPLLAGIIGILPTTGTGVHTFFSLHGEAVHLYGKGIYSNDSVAAAVQIIPFSILSAVLLMKRKPLGLLLSSVMCMKGATMLISLTAMVISQARSGVEMSIAEIVVFPVANILVLIGVFAFMKKIREPAKAA